MTEPISANAPNNPASSPQTPRPYERTNYALRDWDDVRMILALARTGNFQSASRILESDQSTISRRFRRLEASLGTKLFEREGNRLLPTTAGELVFDRALRMEELAQDINRNLSAIDALPRGTVRVSVTEGLGYHWLTPRIVEFCRRYPDIDIELVNNAGEYDQLVKQVDIAIGYARPDKPRMVSRMVGKLRFRLFAAKSYINRMPQIESGSELVDHDLIEYTPNAGIPAIQLWMERVRPRNRIRLRTKSRGIARAALQGGLGISFVPLVFPDMTDLIEIPCDLETETDIWLVSHEEVANIRRVRLLLNFLAAEFSADRVC